MKKAIVNLAIDIVLAVITIAATLFITSKLGLWAHGRDISFGNDVDGSFTSYATGWIEILDTRVYEWEIA